MKQFGIALLMLCAVGLLANEAQAQHFYSGRGFGHISPVRTSGFSISVGNGFNGFSYNNFRGVSPIGGFGPVYRAPGYRPVYAAPVYGYGRPVYGSGISVGFGGVGYGRPVYGRPGCGRW